MTALLEMPAIRERVHRMSLAEYHCLPLENVELLRGIVVTKMSKSPLHEFVTQMLMNLLLVLTPREFQVRREGPLTLRDSEPEPDLLVVRGAATDWLAAHPSTAHLIIEVSVSSIVLDESNADIYAEAGIPEYWMLRPEDRVADIYREPTPGGYLSKTTISDTGSLRCASIPELEIALAEILPVAK